jgi:hypothetical protein
VPPPTTAELADTITHDLIDQYESERPQREADAERYFPRKEKT